MKKKIFRAVAIALIILVFLVLLCTRINKISLIENIKQSIEKIGETTQSSNEVTIKDVTNLEDNGDLEHEHIIKTMYDEKKHWKECTICCKKFDETEHIYTDNWANISLPKCYYTNYCTKICTCGYSYIYNEPCIWNGTYRQWYDAYCHVKNCSKCNNFISHDYYYNGILYKGYGQETCIYNNGSTASCENPSGTCNACRYVYKGIKYHVRNTNQETGEIKCARCNIQIGEINHENIEKISDAPSTYTITSNVILKNGAKFNRVALVQNWNALKEWYDICDQKVTNMNSSKTQFTLITTIKFKKEIKNSVNHSINVEINMDGAIFVIASKSINFYPETTKPTISNISMENNGELINWSKTKPIIIFGNENYCDSVKVKILDDKENVIFSGEANVNSNNYSISCTPQIECDINGRTFKVIVTDTCENSTEQEFTISKVDCIPPTPTSGTEILGDWAKSKDFTFTATDYGIGQVQVAFNDIEDLKLATEDGKTFSRDYKFIGDVYSPKQLSVMYKDGLGNTSIQKITIDKLDNTAPTITNTSIHNDIITVDAHDRHETLGEGSGIVKYRYIASEEKLTNPELTEENSTESANTEIKIKDIYKVKYIYIVAEDYVGNTSKVYEFKVPELILTSSVNLNTADGKGEIILDWSSYDVSDKYFVVYRKKNNQTEWEKIVPLTQKLTGNTYTDKLGNDEAKPETPNITITGDISNNNINITANSTDNGTNYKYYIEGYSSIGTLISKSK